MKHRWPHIMTTELSLMKQMPVKTIKIYFECKKKVEFMHQHEYEWMGIYE